MKSAVVSETHFGVCVPVARLANPRAPHAIMRVRLAGRIHSRSGLRPERLLAVDGLNRRAAKRSAGRLEGGKPNATNGSCAFANERRKVKDGK